MLKFTVFHANGSKSFADMADALAYIEQCVRELVDFQFVYGTAHELNQAGFEPAY